MTAPPTGNEDTVVVLNPESGDGQHVQSVREQAASYGYTVRQTETAEDIRTVTRSAIADGATGVVAAGGDGTVNGVVTGIVEAEALGTVTLGVLPCGTGNDFAANVGVTSIEQGFQVLEAGARRRIDIGFADGHPFVNSCVAGLTAESSAQTDPALKDRFGTLAYVLRTLQTLPSFDGLRLTVTLSGGDDEPPVWSGSAIAVLIGNARHFPPGGSAQANAEDGKLDVTLVEGSGSRDLLRTGTVEAVLCRESAWTSRYTVPGLDIEVHGDAPAAFSLDGEILERDRLSVSVRSRSLTVAVGEAYERVPVATA